MIFKRIQRAYKELTRPTELSDLVDDSATYVNVGKIFHGNEDVTEEYFGDGKAEFLGEGTHEEFIDQERADKGEDKWYKRILRKEDEQ